MHGLLQAVGPEKLNNAGVAALGYPAILATEQYEVQLIGERLNPKAEATSPAQKQENAS